MRRWIAAALCACGALQAQAVKEYEFHLDNGAEVLYQTFSQADEKDPAPNLGLARTFGNVVERSVMDASRTKQLGFDLHIERLSGDPIRFRVSMGPLQGWGYFGQSAAPREIHNGDRVLLDVLEDPGTGKKIFDTFQVGIGVGMHLMPMAKTVPRAPEAGAAIHLQGPALAGGKAVQGKSARTITGSQVAVEIAGNGVYRISTRPEPGFRMEAVAEGNVLMLVSGSERYDIQCTSPVIEGPGAWYLWVRQDLGGNPGVPTLTINAP